LFLTPNHQFYKMHSGEGEHKGIMTKLKEKLHIGGHSKDEDVVEHGHHGAQAGTAPVVGTSSPVATKTTVPTTGAQATNLAGATTTTRGAGATTAGATTTGTGPVAGGATPGDGGIVNATGVYAGEKAGRGGAGVGTTVGQTGATTGTTRATTGTTTGATTGVPTSTTTTSGVRSDTGATGGMNVASGTATHHVSDSHEKGMYATDATAAANPHWQRAEEEIRLAKQEAASVNARSKEAYELAEKTSYLQAQSEDAQRQYNETTARLRELQGSLVTESDIDKQAGAAKAAATAKARAADEQIKYA
jgi:hypothetical protein